MFKSHLSSSSASVRRAFLAIALVVATVTTSFAAAAPASADLGSYSVPDAPVIDLRQSHPGWLTISVTFTAPADDGGSPVTDYLVEYKVSTDSSWSTFSHTPSASTLSYVIRNLAHSTSYDVRVSAVNAVGTSDPSASAPFRLEFFTYTTDNNNNVTVTGCVNYNICASDMEIPSTLGGNPVTEIAEAAFQYKEISSVTLPSTLITIGRNAFAYGGALKTITLPSSLTTIGGGAFRSNQLTSLVIPNSVTSMGNYAFTSNKLTSLTLSNSLKTIASSAFQYNRLTSVTIPNSVTYLDFGAFASNSLTSVTIPNSVTATGMYVFSDNKLTSVVIPSSMTRIADAAFSGNLLTSVTIPNSVVSIADGAFSKNKLTSLTLPSSLGTIGYGAFGENLLTSLVIPASLRGISWYAFSKNLLTSVKFEGNRPESSQGAFDNNPCLSAVDVKAGTTGWQETYQGLPVRISDGSDVSSTEPADLTSPTAVSAIAGVASAKISFGAPVQNGGCSIASYKVTATNISRPLATAVTATGTSSPLTVSGLTNGDQYSFTVTATNGLGAEQTSAASNTVTPATLGMMVVTSLPNALQASWQPLSTDSADHYVVETLSGDGTTCSNTETVCVVSELANGVSQTLQISAYDDSGTLIFQTTFQANSPKDVPDAPLQVSAVPGDASATIRWSAPDNQGSAITSYTVTDSAGKTCQTAGTSCSITGLVPGATDRFTVRATNSIGTSASSDASEFITISATPLKPTGVSVASGDKSLVVTWLASDVNGGSAISYYTVADSQGHSCTGTPESLTCTLLDVTNNVSDVVTVTGTNRDGLTSTQSVAVTAVAGTVASAPLNLVATSGWVSTTLSWTAPATNGGSPITLYVVTGSDGATCAVAAPLTSCTIIELTGGNSQTFSVVAVNSFGSSMASNVVSAIAFDVPSRPTNARATLQPDGSITVQWTAPSGNGSAVSGYTVTSNRGDTCLAASGQTTCNFTGLTQGLGYSFTVVARNLAGDSLGSAPSSTVVDANVPAAPSQVIVDAGDKAVLVSWLTPASNGSDILSYVVTASTGQRCETDQTSCLIAGFTNGSPVTFTVVAINGAGSSAASMPSDAVIPAGAPSIPTNLAVVSALHGSIMLRWDASVSNGSAITSYVVNDTNGHAVCTVTTTFCTITGLTNGKIYSYSVLSTSLAGDSDRSELVSARPITVPTVPTRVSAVAGDSSVTVKFSQSADDGGSIITAYTVTDSYGTVCSSATATSCRFTGLANGTADTFSVTATNAAGTSVAVVLVSMPISAPAAPTNVVAVALNGSALVSWDAAFANGSAVTSYVVTSSGAKTCVTKTTTSCLVSGLINGTSYTFTVKAINVVGMSAASVASQSVTPVTTPSVPRSFAATVGNQSVSFVWDAPSRNGGTPILGYVVSDLDGNNCTTTQALTCTIDGLTNGQSYKFTVSAQNAVGFSSTSTAVSVTPITVATAPVITSIVSVATGLKVNFDSPVNDGGSAVTRYQVSADRGTTWQNAKVSSVKATSFIVGNLNGGTTYGLTMRAFNEAGVSPASEVVNALYIAPPGAPRITSAVVSGTTAKVRYTAPTVTGGAAAILYQYSLDGGLTWHIRPAGTSTEFLLTNLPKATTLKLRMRAVNSAGYGTASAILTLKIK